MEAEDAKEDRFAKFLSRIAIRKPHPLQAPIVICLFFVVVIVNVYSCFRAEDTADWVFSTLEDHTNKPQNDKDYNWLADRNKDLNVWNPNRTMIDQARIDIELSLAALYYERLSSREIGRMRANVNSYLRSNDNDTRTLGLELQKLLDARSLNLPMKKSEKDAFKAKISNQIRSNTQYLEDF